MCEVILFTEDMYISDEENHMNINIDFSSFLFCFEEISANIKIH